VTYLALHHQRLLRVMAARRRSARSSTVAAGWSSRVWATRAPVPAR
jgi:hypothetical protein